jgi:hypothetical protein
MAVQEIGRGRSMAFMSDTTRSWGRDFETLWGEPIDAALPISETNCDSRYYRKFWVNAVRWLAAAKIGKTNSAVTLELSQSYAAPEAKVMASVKVRDPQMRDYRANVSVVMSAPGKSSVSFTAAYDSSPIARRSCAARSTGAYTITAIAAQKGQRIGQDQQLRFVRTWIGKWRKFALIPICWATGQLPEGAASTKDADLGIASVGKHAGATVGINDILSGIERGCWGQRWAADAGMGTQETERAGLVIQWI